MPGRYDTPAQAQFMNTYVPIPFNELLQAGLSKQQQYNAGQGQLDSSLSEAEQIKYIAGSQDEEYVKKNVLGTVEEIVNEYSGKDLSDPNVMREINKRLRTIDKNRVNRVQESATNYQQFQKDLRQLGMQGKGADYLNQFNPQEFSSEEGVFNQSPESRLDYKAAAESYFNDVEEEYLGIKDIDPSAGLKALVHGKSKKALLARADMIAEDYIKSAEGVQHAKQFAYNGVPEEEIPGMMKNYMRNIALEQAKTHVSNPYTDPNFKGADNNPSNFTSYESATFDLESQPYSEQFTNFKKAKKNKEENDSKISQLDKEISLLTKQVSPEASSKARVLLAQKESLQSQNYAVNQYFEKFNNEYINKVEKTPEDFYTQMTGSNEDPSISIVMKEYLEKGAMNFGTAYNNVIGDDKNRGPYSDKYSWGDKVKMNAEAERIKKEYNRYEKNRIQYIEDQWATIDKGITKETSLLPNTNSVGDKIQIPGTQDWVYNPLQGVLNSYNSNPESLDIRRVTGEQLSEKEKNKDLELIKSTLEGESKSGKKGKLEFQSAGSFDPKSPFLNAVLYDANGTRIDNFAINIGNQTQQKKIAESFALIGDVKNALKFENPTYSQDIAKKFEKGIKPKIVDLSILNNEIQLVLSSDEGYYQVYSEGNLIPNIGIPASGGAVESAIYDLYEQNILKARQSAITNK